MYRDERKLLLVCFRLLKVLWAVYQHLLLNRNVSQLSGLSPLKH